MITKFQSQYKRFGTLDRVKIVHIIPSKNQAIDSIWYLPQGKEPYILPQHCPQIYFSLDIVDKKYMVSY